MYTETANSKEGPQVNYFQMKYSHDVFRITASSDPRMKWLTAWSFNNLAWCLPESKPSWLHKILGSIGPGMRIFSVSSNDEIIPISHDIYTDMLCGIYNTENNYKPHGFHTCNDLFNPVVVVFRINVFFFVWRILNHFKSELGNNFCFWAKMLMEYWLISELEMCTATTVSHAPVHIS